MTLLQILVIAVVAFFCIVFVRDGLKHYIGYNPSAPSLWSRIKAWWPGFVKRHIVDDDPFDDESHAETRYSQRDDYIDWSKVPERGNYVSIDDNLNMYWYYNQPALSDLGGVWITSEGEPMILGDDYGLVCSSAVIATCPPWRESLRKRPGK